MKKITVYYDIRETEEELDYPRLQVRLCHITTTEKSYWNKNHAVDDGYGDHYCSIDEAMEQCGAEEVNDSEYVVNDGNAQAVIERMRKKGFDMQTNPDFSAWLRQCEQPT